MKNSLTKEFELRSWTTWLNNKFVEREKIKKHKLKIYFIKLS